MSFEKVNGAEVNDQKVDCNQLKIECLTNLTH